MTDTIPDHIKITLKKEGKSPFFDSIYVSNPKNNHATVDDIAESEQDNKKSDSYLDNDFVILSYRFIKSLNTIDETILSFMAMMPIFSAVHIEREIASFIRQNGKLVDEKDKELIGFIHTERAGEVSELLDRLERLQSGATVIPKLAIIGIVSAYDAFLSDLLKILYERNNAAPISDKTITYQDVLNLGSIDAVKDHIIEKEIESILRENHTEQLKRIETRFSIATTKNLDVLADFVELCERRNLFTHTDGIVSSQYINSCKNSGVDVSKIKIGDKLEVNQNYLKKAIDTASEIGIKLLQVLWRKYKSDEINLSARNLNDICFNLIGQERYLLASKLLDFGLNTMKKHGEDIVRRMMVVNYSNAIKLGGDKEKAKEILEKEDWTACSMDFKICIFAINDDVDGLVSIMEEVVSRKDIDKQSFRTWPVFKTMREKKEFCDKFEQIFGEKIASPKERLNRAKPSPRKRTVTKKPEH